MDRSYGFPPVKWPAVAVLCAAALVSARVEAAQSIWEGPGSLLNLNDFAALTQPHISEGIVEFGDSLGRAFAAGDFDGDGRPDLAVGSPGEVIGGGAPAAGSVFVLQGSGGGPVAGHMENLDQESDVPGTLNEQGDMFGSALAAGDFNGDGFADLAVGTPGEDIGPDVNTGAVYVFMGSAQGPTVGFGITQEDAGGGNEDDDLFSLSLATGDFNGDTYDDLAVGSPGEGPGSEPRAGVIYLFLGSSAGLTTGTRFDQEDAGGTNVTGDDFGGSLTAGDFDFNGLDDLVVGARFDSGGIGVGGGAIYLFNGSVTTGLTGSSGLLQEFVSGETSSPGDAFGSALASGHFNNDAFADLAIGAPGEDIGAIPDGGALFVFLGSASGFISGSVFHQDGNGGVSDADDDFGAALAAGDLNGDGLDDVAVGAPSDRPDPGEPQSGSIYLFAGTPAGILGGDALHQEDLGGTNETGDQFGAALAIADHNVDDAGDLTIGSPGEGPFGEPRGGLMFVIAGLGPAPALTHGGLVGGVSDTVKIWARADRASQLSLEYKLPSASWPGTSSAPVSLNSTDDFTGVISIPGLSPSTVYDYRLLLDGVVQDSSVSSFRTLPPEDIPGVFTFAVCGDTRFQNDNPFVLFDSIATHDPDFLLQTGDQVYADAPQDIVEDVPGHLPSLKAAYERKYRENWAEPHFRSFTRSHPVFMIWDDHEIDNNWDSGTSGRYAEASAVYEEYQDSHNPSARVTDTNYYSFRVRNVDFYILDVRTYRSPNSDPDGPAKTMLGSVQKADLLNWLSTATGRLKFLVSGVGWRNFSEPREDSWDSFETERNEIFNYIKSQGVTGVVLLSGDQHYASVHRLREVAPFYLYEFNATPLGFTPLGTSAPVQDADSLFAYTGSFNFGVFRVDTSDTLAGRACLEFDVYDDDNSSVFHIALSDSQLLPTEVPAVGGEVEELPDEGLFASVPNPFTTHTYIPFALRTAGRATLAVYDVAGRRVATLVDGELPAGRHGVVVDARDLSAGVYIYKLSVNGTTETRKMVLTR